MVKRGFTLIELLIVVAIIAILAAIAVPNFLEAQTRSKVSRVKGDHRTLATAIQAYFVDHNRYPNDQDNDPTHQRERGFYMLTSPVAYISSFPADPFSDQRFNEDNDSSVAAFYVMGSGSDNSTLTSIRAACYVLISLGPDRRDSSSGQDSFPLNTNLAGYDPTNGTISSGDIYRFGGDYLQGNWRLNGVAWQAAKPKSVIPD